MKTPMTPHTKKKALASGAGKKGVPASPGLRPKKRYRLLKDGEVIRRGDQVWAFGEGPWSKPSSYCPGEVFNGEDFYPYRREVKSPEGSAKAAGRSRKKASPKSPSHPPKSKRGEA